eukprot:1190275-Prorocentrum_minimum.AAC.2
MMRGFSVVTASTSYSFVCSHRISRTALYLPQRTRLNTRHHPFQTNLSARKFTTRAHSNNAAQASINTASSNMLELEPYTPPNWAAQLSPIPTEKFSLGQLPTPIHRWNIPGLPDGCEMWIKRDDLSGMQLSGNKVRKLEFLLAEAKVKTRCTSRVGPQPKLHSASHCYLPSFTAQGCDSVITIGGVQSNHCRATAVAAKYLGLEPYLILRTEKKEVDRDP